MSHNESFHQMSQDWNNRLAAEGLPEELEMIESEEQHSPAYEAAISDLYIHYATTASAEHGVHRQALEALRNRIKAGGGTQEEVELLSEDFAREVEDKVTELQTHALEYAREAVVERPMLAVRPEAITKIVFTKLRQESAGPVPREALTELAERASATIH